MELLARRLSTLANNSDLQDLSANVEAVFADMIEFECAEGVQIPPVVFGKVREALLLVSGNDELYQPSIGRPRFNIPYDLLVQLLELGFTVTAIADIISISRSTVNRRMKEYGLCASMTYSNITDVELDHVVQSVSHAHPGCGHKMMQGHLIQRGIRIQQLRIRESLRRTDPEGIAFRQTSSVRRRQYNVSQPMELWHVDGNHKLIRCTLQVYGN